jgi:hypothetical protein
MFGLHTLGVGETTWAVHNYTILPNCLGNHVELQIAMTFY